MSAEVRIVTVDETSVDDLGFFCYKSKKRTEGYRLKLEWLRSHLSEDMRIKIIHEGKRSVGFIEYLPGEFGWRAVDAQGCMLIHCL